MNDKMNDKDLDPVHHIAIQVNDLERALAWYCSNFRINTLYQDETWALLQFKNVKIALVVPGQHPPHIAFERPDAESFGPLTGHRDGTSSVYIRDSEGNTVEIMTPSPVDET